MTIQLHAFSASPNCLVIFLVLKELGLSHEVVQLASIEEVQSPEYLATKHPL
jgi:glutathione S-transferase